MKVDSSAPADTSMMTIVHNALRRDLVRARERLAAPAQVPPAQRRAIGEHLGWLMHFLHAHHESEDVGLYPFAIARAAGRADLLEVLERMGTEHEGIAAGITGVEIAGSALAGDPSDAVAAAAVEAIDALSAVLLPHLAEEEREAMPIVSQLMTHGEWRTLEDGNNLDGKSKAQLGFEGHWLIDGVSGKDRAVVLGLVPPVVRFVLLHGFARRYRRHAARCWGSGDPLPRSIPMSASVSVDVDVDIDAVWAVVSDPTRVGEWSGECVRARWVRGADHAVPGARFRGRNVSGHVGWGRACEVDAVAPYEIVWHTVPSLAHPDKVTWWLRLERIGDRTRISQGYDATRVPRVLSFTYAVLVPNHRDRTEELKDDLRRLAAVAAAGRPARAG